MDDPKWAATAEPTTINLSIQRRKSRAAVRRTEHLLVGLSFDALIGLASEDITNLSSVLDCQHVLNVLD